MKLGALLQRPRAAGAAVLTTARDSLPDALMVAGACCISYGAWLVYEPAGFIVAGVLSLGGGVLVARARAPGAWSD